MSRSKWKRCPKTGIRVAVLAQVDEKHLDSAGDVDLTQLVDCDVFNVREIATLAGFRDARYFRDKILTSARSPFHVRRLQLTGSDSGCPIVDVVATHTNSARAGGYWWWQAQSDRARQRVITDPTSSQIIR